MRPRLSATSKALAISLGKRSGAHMKSLPPSAGAGSALPLVLANDLSCPIFANREVRLKKQPPLFHPNPRVARVRPGRLAQNAIGQRPLAPTLHTHAGELARHPSTGRPGAVRGKGAL